MNEVLTHARRQMDMPLTVTGCPSAPRCEGVKPADRLSLTSVEAFSPNGDKVS